MSLFLGIDTSNYTTSVALCDEDGVLQSERRLLSVAQGERGLRQSDALFLHTRALPELISRIGKREICAIGYSATPRDAADSYMPCFLAGKCVAESMASVMGIPAYSFSHQAGHISAALYSAKREDLCGQEFLAFHVSGGTTDLLHVAESGHIERVGGTADLNAGQLIDRIGVLLGLSFPCGAALEKLAQGYPFPRVKVSVRDLECNLSGHENRARQMIEGGASHGEVAAFSIAAVMQTLDALTAHALAVYGALPLIYAGGVMSNQAIRAHFSQTYGGHFAEPAFSCDNAAGVALLCRNRYRWEDAK